jgi:hypothetical protein
MLCSFFLEELVLCHFKVYNLEIYHLKFIFLVNATSKLFYFENYHPYCINVKLLNKNTKNIWVDQNTLIIISDTLIHTEK